MRDLERIGRVLQKLELYWREHPDYRLGQIVSNANDIVRGRGYDIFYLEDDLLEEALGYMP